MLLDAGLSAVWIFMNTGLVTTVLVKPAERERRLELCGTLH